MKGKLQFPVSLCWFLPVLVFMLVSCGDDDDYHYPSVKLDFLTAQAGADGSLQSVLTDEGETLAIVEDASKTRIDANASARIVSNYGKAEAADGTSGVKLYAVLSAISPVPQSADKFKDGIKRDPADILSIWMGIDYLNIMLEIKLQNGKHSFHFIEDEVTTDKEAGTRTVRLSLYHDDGGDVQAYTKRAYASIPLRQYAEDGIDKVTIYFSLNTYSGKEVTYEFEYNPQ